MIRLAILALLGVILAACVEGGAVDRDALCDLDDCEVRPAGAAGVSDG